MSYKIVNSEQDRIFKKVVVVYFKKFASLLAEDTEKSTE
jgi:hypothetical protein